MRILLTNDDGIDAPGLAALERACAGLATELIVAAPADPASQIGHRVTTHQPIAVENRGKHRFAIRGTPADCVRVALKGLLDLAPDYVISGINQGGNLGRHDHYISGTIAAAREAAFHGVPAAAVSQYVRPDLPLCWDTAARRTARVLAELLAQPLAPGELWNVNLPHLDADAPEPALRHCELEPQPLEVIYAAEDAGSTFRYCGKYHRRGFADGSDVAVCFGGNIAVTRVKI